MTIPMERPSKTIERLELERLRDENAKMRSALVRIADISFEVEDALGSCIKIAAEALSQIEKD